MKIRELPILACIDPKTQKTHAAAKKCCGWEKPAIWYPFLEDPKEALTDNRKQAMTYAMSLEKKLVKHQLSSQFEPEFQKFIETK